ncbi:unnamed protein product [Pleuronectes platessa]|uniref:Uncharacterized protein n=1 Tax=Pleuronectes platessa TaxID=8262 RepID=A0A9N7V2M7_PLEPL|nr:unnamed protein product [Pleuronectes platessa]
MSVSPDQPNAAPPYFPLPLLNQPANRVDGYSSELFIVGAYQSDGQKKKKEEGRGKEGRKEGRRSGRIAFDIQPPSCPPVIHLTLPLRLAIPPNTPEGLPVRPGPLHSVWNVDLRGRGGRMVLLLLSSSSSSLLLSYCVCRIDGGPGRRQGLSSQCLTYTPPSRPRPSSTEKREKRRDEQKYLRISTLEMKHRECQSVKYGTFFNASY